MDGTGDSAQAFGTDSAHPGSLSASESPAASAPAERPGAFGAVVLAWLFPGAGHLWLGRRAPAVFVALAIVPLFVAGMALTGWENVSHERHPFYFIIHALAGVPTLIASALTADVTIDRYYPDRSIGELFTACACLLNLIAATDVWARCRRGDPEGADALAATDDADEAGAPAESAGSAPTGGAS